MKRTLTKKHAIKASKKIIIPVYIMEVYVGIKNILFFNHKNCLLSSLMLYRGGNEEYDPMF